MSRSRDLLLVTPDLFDRGGGIARIARATSLACHEVCSRRGWRLTAFSLRDEGAQRDERFLPAGAGYHGFGGDRGALARALLSRALRRSHVGTVFCHANLASLGLLFPLRRWNGTRDYAVIAHGVEVYRRLPAIRRAALKCARAVWPVSDFTGRQVAALQGVSGERLRTIHNCLDPHWLDEPLQSAHGSERYVLCVSRLSRADRYKGIDDLIVAFGLAAGRLPELRLVLVGDGDDAARLRALAASGPVAGRISFAGDVDDARLKRLYSGCEFFAMPSGKEGFGLVFLEAMANGKAVLAARSTAVPEVVLEGATGLLVEYGDIEQIAAAMLELGSNRARAREMGERGRHRVSERFSFRRYCSDLDDALASWG